MTELSTSIRTVLRSGRVALGLLLLALALTAAEAWAATAQTSARVSGGFGPVARGSKHPKKATAFLVVPADLDGVAGGHRLCAAYQRPAGSNNSKGSLSAKVAVERAGRTEVVVSLSKSGVSGGRSRSCAASSVELREGDLLIWSFTFKGMPKLPSAGVATFVGEALAPADSFGALWVSGGESDESLYWIDGANLVFCSTDAGFADLWIRLAADRSANGENAPHVDIDVCNFAGGGRHSPHDPQNPSCGSSKTFDIFWHDAEGRSFANSSNARDCQLDLVESGSTLEGAFVCRQLGGASGGPIDLFGGAFRCRVD